jgi:hypothetical protein
MAHYFIHFKNIPNWNRFQYKIAVFTRSYYTPEKLNVEKSMGMSFFTSCPLTGGLSVPLQTRTMSLSNGTGLKRPTDSSLGGHGKKRHPHAQRMVSFIYNPGAKRRGHLLKS